MYLLFVLMLGTLSGVHAAEYRFPSDDLLTSRLMVPSLAYQLSSVLTQAETGASASTNFTQRVATRAAGYAVTSKRDEIAGVLRNFLYKWPLTRDSWPLKIAGTMAISKFIKPEDFVIELRSRLEKIDSMVKTVKGMEIYLGEFVREPLFYFKTNRTPAELEKFEEFLESKLMGLELAFGRAPWFSGFNVVEPGIVLNKIDAFRQAMSQAIGYYATRSVGAKLQLDERYGTSISARASELRNVVRERMPFVERQQAIYAQQIKSAGDNIQQHYNRVGLKESPLPLLEGEAAVREQQIRTASYKIEQHYKNKRGLREFSQPSPTQS